MKEKLEKFIEGFKKTVEENFLKDGHIAPVFIMVTANYDLFPMLLAPFFSDDAGKELASRYIKAAVNQIKPVLTVHISEAWFLNINKNELEKIGTPIVRTHKDRIESVCMVICTKIDGVKRERLVRWEIIRPENGKPYLKYIDTHENEKSDGRFNDLI